MTEGLVSVGFIALAGIIGLLLKPTEDQLRPLEPEASSGDAVDHGHHH